MAMCTQGSHSSTNSAGVHGLHAVVSLPKPAGLGDRLCVLAAAGADVMSTVKEIDGMGCADDHVA